MGVWIETAQNAATNAKVGVTPCMGVWIETIKECICENFWAVTPCMGVWIETFGPPEHLTEETSHPVWVCGLKRLQEGRGTVP